MSDESVRIQGPNKNFDLKLHDNGDGTFSLSTSLIALLPAALTSGGGVKAGLVDALPAGTNSVGGIKDDGPQWTSAYGIGSPQARFTSANQSASAASITEAPTSGQKIVVTDVLISVDTAMRVDLKEETSATVIASFYLPANGTVQWTPRSKTKLATANKKLQVQTSASGNIAITAHYFSEA